MKTLSFNFTFLESMIKENLVRVVIYVVSIEIL